MPLDQGIQVMPCFLGKQLAREFDGAQNGRMPNNAAGFELRTQKAVIKTCIVGDKHLAMKTIQNFGSDILETGLILHHLVGNSGERRDKRRNACAWVDQLAPATYLALPQLNNPDLRDAISSSSGAGGLKVNKGTISLEDAKAIGKILADFKCIRELDVSNCGLDTTTTKDIADGLMRAK